MRADTNMINDAADAFANHYDRDTLSAVFPYILEDLKGKDANFEMISSNTLQQVRLIYEYNFRTHSIATVFIHTKIVGNRETGSRDLIYQRASKIGEVACKLLTEELDFDDINFFTDLAKA